MPDPHIETVLSKEDQSYFDNRGNETPDVSVKSEEPKEVVVEEPKPEPKKVGRPPKAKQETIATTSEEPIEIAPPKDTPETHIEKLNVALREERKSRAEETRVVNERLRLLQEAVISARQSQQQPQAEVVPDVEKDPLGTIKYLLQKTREGDQQRILTQNERYQQQQEMSLIGEAQRLEMQYLSEQPDYDPVTRNSAIYNEASSFLINMRKAELAATGTYNPMQIGQIITAEAKSLAQQAIQGGRNPGQVVMDIAKARGFSPQPKAPKETEAEKIARIAKGQEAGFSIGQAAGSKAPNNSKLDAKTLANMSEEDFTAFMDKAKKSDLRNIFGD